MFDPKLHAQSGGGYQLILSQILVVAQLEHQLSANAPTECQSSIFFSEILCIDGSLLVGKGEGEQAFFLRLYRLPGVRRPHGDPLKRGPTEGLVHQVVGHGRGPGELPQQGRLGRRRVLPARLPWRGPNLQGK